VDAHYDDIHNGNVTFKGGWRIYSSGPGIYVGLVLTRLLGIRSRFGSTIFDPVMPKALDVLEATVQICGRPVTLRYHVSGTNEGVTRLEVNGTDIPFTREKNPYRTGGAVVSYDALIQALGPDENRVEISM